MKMLQVENERKKYELERERQEKEIIKKNLDSISNLFEHESLKMKKIEIIENITSVSLLTLKWVSKIWVPSFLKMNI